MTRSINGMAERFRELLAADGYIDLPGCYDVLSAMLLQQAGFRSVFLSGYGLAASSLGNPDIGLTSLSETAAATKNTSHAIQVPLVVDADNGYGDEDNVIRTIYELESAGAAGIQLEDQVLPKRCGHAAGKKVLPLPAYIKKLEAALRARQTPLVVIARTDALSLDEGIRRARIFQSVGADAVIIDGLRSMDDVKRVGELPGHKQINLIGGGLTPILPAPELHKLGFKIILYSTPALYVAAQAIRTAMKTLFETKDLTSIMDQSTTFEAFQSYLVDEYMARPHMRSAKTQTTSWVDDPVLGDRAAG